MARDIEEFLRKAAERRKQQQQKKQRGPGSSQRMREIVEDDIEVLPPVEIVKPKKRKVLRKQPPRQQPELRQKKNMRHETVAEHVSSHIDSSSIADHAENLGERIQNADDRIAARLQKRFDHDVSKLDDMPTVQDDVVATVTRKEVSAGTEDMLRMLRNPTTIRQAILVSEILKRPQLD